VYAFQVNPELQLQGFEIPAEVARFLEVEKLRKKEKGANFEDMSNQLTQSQQNYLSNSPMIQ
jgi:hypothetical protein